MITLLFSMLLFPSPKIVFSKEEIALYEELAKAISDGRLLYYQNQYKKFRFLMYLSSKGNYVFHGSNNQHIDCFEPREQTLYNGVLTKAVFASSDPIWSMFYAIFDRSKLIGSFRNACILGPSRKYHLYSINESTMKNKPWTNGTIYIIPKGMFNKSGHGKVQFDEWICHEPVKPIGKINISIEDFYYKNRIATHKDKESLVKTWLFYKARTLLANTKRVN